MAPPKTTEQLEAMAQVCLDLHKALGVEWGGDPYIVIRRLSENYYNAMRERNDIATEMGKLLPIVTEQGATIERLRTALQAIANNYTAPEFIRDWANTALVGVPAAPPIGNYYCSFCGGLQPNHNSMCGLASPQFAAAPQSQSDEFFAKHKRPYKDDPAALQMTDDALWQIWQSIDGWREEDKSHVLAFARALLSRIP